jgi:hypothetical protein
MTPNYALKPSVTALNERAAGARTIVAPAARQPRSARPAPRRRYADLTKAALRHISVAALIAVAVFATFVPYAAAKGEGVGFWLEGTVSGVRIVGRYIQLSVAGRLWLRQFPDGQPPGQHVEFDCPEGISATLTQAQEFFAMSTDWGGGALRQPGHLHKILEAAAKRGNVVRFQLLEPRIDFAGGQCPALSSAVVRATDTDLE